MKPLPPIPPNCPYFERDGYFKTPALAWDGYGLVNLEPPERDNFALDGEEQIKVLREWRPIIAATAIAFWEKEYNRLVKTGASFNERCAEFDAVTGKIHALGQAQTDWEDWGEE